MYRPDDTDTSEKEDAREMNTSISAEAVGSMDKEKNRGPSIWTRNMNMYQVHAIIDVEAVLDVTAADLEQAKATAENLLLEDVRKLMRNVQRTHERDPNFPHSVLLKIDDFLNDDDIFENPSAHQELIWEMKIEAALMTNNSPYAEVRAVACSTDDPSLPCSTVRAWVIGMFFAVLTSFVNQLFSIRLPPVYLSSMVPQLLAYPVGKWCERHLPDWRFRLFGVEHSLNPGPFNHKEHMMTTIMSSSATIPYTTFIVWSQVLPQYFNQPWAGDPVYQLTIAVSCTSLGYGLAGLVRSYLVYPAFCIWPHALACLAMNSALHNPKNEPVPGPFNTVWHCSRYRWFMVAFVGMAIYFWIPSTLASVMTYFSWATWIAPDNVHINVLFGMQNGLSLFNPIATFDWNIMVLEPLMMPAFCCFNYAAGFFLSGLIILAVYYTNTYETAYFPINSNRIFDHWGNVYNVSRAVDDQGLFNEAKYLTYSAPYMSAANVVAYACYFCMYSAIITYAALFHGREMLHATRNLWRNFRNTEDEPESEAPLFKDIHCQLMGAYPEVSGFWYMTILVVSAAVGVAGVTGFPTYTTVGVIPFGLALALIFVIPVGLVASVSGVEVPLNVIAELLGGLSAQGNALATNFFKAFGFLTCSQAINFAMDLKLGHYTKVPPRHLFWAQVLASFTSNICCVIVTQIQMRIRNVCTELAPGRMTCPNNNTFFTASVLWGSIGPQKVWSANGQYGACLLGFPVGVVLILAFYGLTRWKPRSNLLRQMHPVIALRGACDWAPFSFGYMMPVLPVTTLSWLYIRPRYLAFWSKYNYVTSAAFGAGIGVSAALIFFIVNWNEFSIDWWGNRQPYVGCEGTPCSLKTLAKGERIYPWWDGTKVLAP